MLINNMMSACLQTYKNCEMCEIVFICLKVQYVFLFGTNHELEVATLS